MHEVGEIILAEIRKQGVITLARFMELALYCPVYGYYEKERDKIGRRGDYFTSVSVGSLFGELLACQFAEWFEGKSGGEKCQESGSECHGSGQGGEAQVSSLKSQVSSPKAEVQSLKAEGESPRSQVQSLRSQVPNPESKVESAESQVSSLKSEERGVEIVEAGAHDGRLARDILSWLREWRAELFERLEYCIVEPSERRREWQRRTLNDFENKVRWVGDVSGVGCRVPGDECQVPGDECQVSGDECQVSGVGCQVSGDGCREEPSGGELGADGGTGLEQTGGERGRGRGPQREQMILGRSPASFRIIFSNELLDAMPVHRLGWDAKERAWFEWGITEEAGRFAWARMPAVTCRLPEPSPLEPVLPDGFVREVCPAAADWWREAASVLGRGRLVTFDYGLVADEVLVPERAEGTLRAYARHRVSADVLSDPGEQDLTAHVDFSAIQQAGESAGLRTETLVTQSRFLTHIVAKILSGEVKFGEWTPERTRQFQTLTHPEHLGGAFRVLGQVGEGGRLKAKG